MLKAEIKDLEAKRKPLISKIIDNWKDNSGLDDEEKLLKQGDIEEIYADFVKKLGTKSKADTQELLKKIKKAVAEAGAENNYSYPMVSIAKLEKNLYKLYESYFLSKYL